MRTEERAEQVAKAIEPVVIVAALLVIPLLLLQRETSEPWTTVATALNWGTWLVFVGELVVMLSVVPDRRAWVREHPVEVLVTLLTPPVLPAGLAAARFLRLLRVARLLRLAPFVRGLTSTDGLKYAAVLALLVLIGGATAFSSFEPGASTWDGIYWAVTTMATVGYGDITPATDGGRVIAMALMVVGIGFGGLLIGAITDRFVERSVREEEQQADATIEDVLTELQLISARLGALEQAVAAPGALPGSGDGAR